MAERSASDRLDQRSRDRAKFGFSELVAPLSVEEFRSQFWTKMPVHLAGDATPFRAELATWKELSGDLHDGSMALEDLEFALAERRLPLRTWRDARSHISAGAMVVLKRVHRRHERLLAASRHLEREIGFRININAYRSGPQTNGYPLHYDTHEAFIVQLEGGKHWEVFAPTVAAPAASQPSSFEARPTVSPILTCSLEAGEVLYVPRGFWHRARTAANASLHLTIGVVAPVAAEFVDWLAERLRDDHAWRVYVPSQPGAQEGAAQAELMDLVERLRLQLADPSLVDEFLTERRIQDLPD